MAGLIGRGRLKMNVTHNGTFPRKEVEKWAEIIVPITTDIKISWNGAKTSTAESVMKGLNFNQAVDNIKKFVSYRNKWFQVSGQYCSVSFQMTFMRNNMQEIEEIIKLAADIGIDRIKGHHLWVHHPEMKKYSFKFNNETIREWNLIVQKAKNTVDTHRKSDGSGIKLENFYRIEDKDENNIPEHYNCPFLEKELWISATGKISPCCAPDDLRESLGSFGNISNQTIKETLRSDQYIKLVNNYKNTDLCKNCQMRKP